MSAIRLELTFRHPPETVWHALTTPGMISRWLMETTFEPRLGATFQFKSKPFGGWDGIVHCTVTAFEPPRHLAYTWKSNMIDTVVRYTLTAEGQGTRLRFEHDGFRGFKGAMAKFFMGPGWREMMTKSLAKALDEM